MTITTSQPYFSRNTTSGLIKRLSGYEKVAVVVGAGWSVDWGLPNWSTLIHDLLAKKVAATWGLNTPNDEFARKVLAKHGAIAAASLIRESLNRDEKFDGLRSTLEDELYKGRVGDFGASAVALARFVFDCRIGGHGVVQIITTNYDTSLEDALLHPSFEGVRAAERITNVPSVATADAVERYQQASGCIPVYHLHGVLGPEGDERHGRLIFSEEDYAAASREEHDWRADLINGCLGDADCVTLFVGMSLSDPNVLRILFQAQHVHPETAIVFLPRQANQVGSRDSVDGAVLQCIELAERARLKKIHVTKEQPDFYSEVPQFLSELAAARLARRSTALKRRSRAARPPRRPWGYSERLRGWHEIMVRAGRLNAKEDEPFKGAQLLHREILRATRYLVYEVVNEYQVSDARDRFAIQLWARNPHNRSLELWGSSEKAWLERQSLNPAPIEHGSRYNAVRAFCAGGVRMEDASEKLGSRWQQSIATAIYLGDHWCRLPVGVIVLETDRAKGQSCLKHLGPVSRHDVADLIRRVGALMLSPEVPLAAVQDLLDSLVSRHVFNAADASAELRALLVEMSAKQRPIFSKDGKAYLRARSMD